MSIRAFAIMTCDRCAATLPDLPAGGALALARWRHGWRRVGRPFGLPQDFCPECYADHERDSALAKVEARQAARAAGLGNKWE